MLLKRKFGVDLEDTLDSRELSSNSKLCRIDPEGGFEPDLLLTTQSLPYYVDDIFDQMEFPTHHVGDVNLLNLETLYAPDEDSIEQWAADNMLLQTKSSSPEAQPADEMICYGMIQRAQVKLLGSMPDLDKRMIEAANSSLQGYLEMEVKRTVEHFSIAFRNDSMIMGELNTQIQGAFEAVHDQHIDYQVLAPIRLIRETISRATKEKEAVVRVSINLYGSRERATIIGRELSARKVYLQRPERVKPGFLYDNPHILRLPEYAALAIAQPTVSQELLATEIDATRTVKNILPSIFSSLKRHHALTGLEGDARLRTGLLDHQKEALDFMVQRESGPIPEEFRLWKPEMQDGQQIYRHAIAPDVRSGIPQDETGGGILADEMGMGKTLCILALVLRTLHAGHNWAITSNSTFSGLEACMSHAPSPAQRSRATLVVASSDLMINEWFQEMKTHYDSDTVAGLKTIKYHGQSRVKDIIALQDADIVITTYHTLASDVATQRKPLHNIEWFRLVLDEAHIIRRPSTTLYRAVAEVEARARWCLTGTPIQNRLEDIGALFAFMRFNPFHKLWAFRKHIVVPFEEGGKLRSGAIERFTQLLDAVCLRRTKDLLHLPPQKDRVRMVGFSDAERQQYGQTKRTMFRAIRNQVGVYDRSSTLGMFQLQLQLRILCNHGTFQQEFSWNRHKLHLLDEREAMEMTHGREGEARCTACRESQPSFGEGSNYKQYHDVCMHIICSECVPKNQLEGPVSSEQNLGGFPSRCPFCAPLWGSMTRAMPTQATYHEDPEAYFRRDGRSSKIEALLDDVKKDVEATKSIVFSCWTHTLDLIARYFSETGIPFQRIDGECPTSRRQHILHEFSTSPALRVLIMTTGTGAVGLNLAAANRVFIVEPQWNPSVENQAISRALRLGQAQDVEVTRYVVEDSVEQEMRTLQDKKLETAEIAWK